MGHRLKSKVELFASNVQALKGTFVWKNVLLKRMAALLYAGKDERIDLNALRESHDLIKSKTGVFSYFRSNSMVTLSTLLSMHDDKQAQLDKTLAVYERMKEYRFWKGDYLVVAAYQIAENTREEKYDETIRRAKAFYDGMKAQHPFITGHSSYIFAALLGLSDMKIESGLMRIEGFYRAFKPHFRSGYSVQALAQVLALSAGDRDVEGRVLYLSDKFRQRNMRMDRQYILSSLGILSILPADLNGLVNDVIETYEQLRTKKGFGRWTVTKRELLMLSSALVCFDHIAEENNQLLTTTLSTSITNIIIAQQTAIAVAVATSSSAAASSGSS
ncbi:MAG: DUF4003 family protein [Christensenellales bacterium]|jgi:hypothetical protein